MPRSAPRPSRLAKLQQQKTAPTIDVAWMDGGISELALAADVTDNLDPAAIPNLANTLPEAIYKSGATTYAVGTGYYSLGLTYNTQKVKAAPTSWNDLWKPEFEDAVTIPSPANSSGVPFVMFLSKIWGRPGQRSRRRPSRRSRSSRPRCSSIPRAPRPTPIRAAKRSSARISTSAPGISIDKGLPIGFVVPKEGAWATDARLHLVKGTPKKEAAAESSSTRR